jgi:LEA14-like dessication related protein
MKKLLRWCVVSLMAIYLGCAAKKVEVKAESQPAQPPIMEFAGVKFLPDSFRGMQVSWSFELQGKSSQTFELAECGYRLELEGLDPMSGQVASPGAVAPGDKKPLEIRVALPWPAEKERLAEFLGRQNIPYKLEVFCTAGGQKVQAGDSGNIPLQKLPRLTVSGANAERFSGKEFRLNFELALANENSFSVQVRKINYRISVEGKKLSEGTLPVEEEIAASADTIYEITSGTLSVATDKSLADLLKKTSLNYGLEGEVEFEGLSVTVDESGTVSFPR